MFEKMLGNMPIGRPSKFGEFFNPFFGPRYSFRPYAVAGAAPLTVGFQPLTRGIIGEFHWDFNGDGVIDDITTHRTSFTYTEYGKYHPRSYMTDDFGHTFYYNESEVIEVTPGFEGEESTNHKINPGDNNDWDKAVKVRPGTSLYYECSSGYNFFKLIPNTNGRFMIRTRPVGEKAASGLVVTLHTEVGFVLNRSGGRGEYGYIVADLHERSQYYVKIYCAESTVYKFDFILDNGERPEIPNEKVNVVKLERRNIIKASGIDRPYNAYNYVNVVEEDGEQKVKVKFPEFDRPVDVYIVIANRKHAMYVTESFKLTENMEPVVVNTTKPFNGEEKEIFSIPAFVGLDGYIIYIGIVPTGQALDNKMGPQLIYKLDL